MVYVFYYLHRTIHINVNLLSQRHQDTYSKFMKTHHTQSLENVIKRLCRHFLMSNKKKKYIERTV